MAPIWYSVSPRRNPTSFGGKKSEKRSPRMPTAFAAMKWPASCSTISAQKPAIAITQVTAKVSQAA